MCFSPFFSFFFFNDTATTEIYTLSLHDALPIYPAEQLVADVRRVEIGKNEHVGRSAQLGERSEEHTSELQSQSNLVCRLLLEKKKNTNARLHHQRSCPELVGIDSMPEKLAVRQG